MTKSARNGGVSIGDVSGGIHHSVIAGGDVRDITITLGGRQVKGDKDPEPGELRELLLAIRKEVAELAAQQAALEKVSPGASSIVKGAEAKINAAVDHAQGEGKPKDAKTIQSRLKEATTLITTFLEGTKTIAEKRDEAQKALDPVMDRVGPLVDKLAVAASWVARLWLPM